MTYHYTTILEVPGIPAHDCNVFQGTSLHANLGAQALKPKEIKQLRTPWITYFLSILKVPLIAIFKSPSSSMTRSCLSVCINMLQICKIFLNIARNI